MPALTHIPKRDTSKPRLLTAKQKEFVRLVGQGESPRAAGERVWGAANGYAHSLIKRSDIRALIDAEKAKYEAAAQMTRKKVMDGLLEAVEMAKLMSEPASMIAGWREIGKMCGYYEPIQKKIDINVSGNVVMQRLERLSDADLIKLIQQEVKSEAEDAVLIESEDEDDEPV
jgi:hypothetical protein